jgi:ribonuclease E
VKQILRSVDETFDERRYGFTGIVEALRYCQREGLFRLDRDRQGVLRVYPGPALQRSPATVPPASDVDSAPVAGAVSEVREERPDTAGPVPDAMNLFPPTESPAFAEGSSSVTPAEETPDVLERGDGISEDFRPAAEITETAATAASSVADTRDAAQAKPARRSPRSKTVAKKSAVKKTAPKPRAAKTATPRKMAAKATAS